MLCSTITVSGLLFASHTVHVTAEQLRWPYNLPDGIKYFPEDEPLMRRNEEAQEKLQNEKPVGIRKMSLDEGEMFFPHYWTFESDEKADGSIASPDNESIIRRSPALDEDGEVFGNETLEENIWPVIALHTNEEISRDPLLARYLPVSWRKQLSKRFQCPSGTFSCTSINRPNSCCANGETCQLIQDTGLGDVGCCAADQACGGQLSGCPQGYTSCPNNPGGGCCLPGYACYNEGCAVSSTNTVIVTPTVTQTVGSSSLPPVTLTSTTTVVVPPPGQTTPSPTTTSQTSNSPTSSRQSTSSTSVVVVTTTSSIATLVCSTGFRSCPPSLGGGCCPTNSACGSPTCPALSSTQSLVPPVRGTTDGTSTTRTSSSTSASYTDCPTGFYACSAFYVGGCCRTGRDCSSTSCPVVQSTTLVSDGQTIVAPTGSGITANTNGLRGTCPTGWALCPTSEGGGCCPSGYACGTSCTVQASATQTGFGQLINKVQPSAAGKVLNALTTSWLAVLTTCTSSAYLVL